MKRNKKTCNDYFFGQKLVEPYTGIKYVVVGIQPDNGKNGSIVCFRENEFHPVVFAPEYFGTDKSDFTIWMLKETDDTYACMLTENCTGESINLVFFGNHKHLCEHVDDLTEVLDKWFGTVTVR